MIIGQSNIQILKVYTGDKKLKRKKTLEDASNYLYTIQIDNLTFDDLEYVYSVVNYINYRRLNEKTAEN